MKLAMVIEIGGVAIKRLQKLADHAKVPGGWTCRAVAGRRRAIAFGLKPLAGSLHWSRDFEQNKELPRIRILSFVDNDPIILVTNALRHVWQTQQFGRNCDLIRVSNCAAS